MYFIKRILPILISFNIVCGELQPQPNRIIMRILTMNTWQAGQKVENGFSKIAKHIKALHADVVLLQEMNAKAFDELMKKLGNQWSGQIHLDHLERRTWSSVWDEAFEPSDRIDFIFYKSDQLKPVRSFTYSGTEALKKLPEKDRWVDTEELEERDWSSDHYAVVTDFVMDNRKLS
uniref:Endo/exonuclease/phosphatase domain-containing protein n=1 Tax=Globodera pallida TaxID=36090 RepID=A0A183C434_GLOPA